MVLDGYDHIVEIVDADGSTITKVARSRGHFELAAYLDSIRDFEVFFIMIIECLRLINSIFYRKIVKSFSMQSGKEI